MNISVDKIFAYGCYKSFIWITLPNGVTRCIRVSREIYNQFRSLGVPTAQSFRGKNNE